MERGDLLELRAPRNARGHEQKGRRYAVVVQADEVWPASTVIVAPTSTSAPPRFYRPTIRIGKTRTTVMVDQLGAYDLSRFGDSIGSVSRRELGEIEQALVDVLGLGEVHD
jgi:mRNA interferase MazF